MTALPKRLLFWGEGMEGMVLFLFCIRFFLFLFFLLFVPLSLLFRLIYIGRRSVRGKKIGNWIKSRIKVAVYYLFTLESSRKMWEPLPPLPIINIPGIKLKEWVNETREFQRVLIKKLSFSLRISREPEDCIETNEKSVSKDKLLIVFLIVFIQVFPKIFDRVQSRFER